MQAERTIADIWTSVVAKQKASSHTGKLARALVAVIEVRQQQQLKIHNEVATR